MRRKENPYPMAIKCLIDESVDFRKIVGFIAANNPAVVAKAYSAICSYSALVADDDNGEVLDPPKVVSDQDYVSLKEHAKNVNKTYHPDSWQHRCRELVDEGKPIDAITLCMVLNPKMSRAQARAAVKSL